MFMTLFLQNTLVISHLLGHKFQDTLLNLRQVLATESLLEIMKNAF